MTSIFGAPLIEVNPQIMPAWQFAFKRGFDMLASIGGPHPAGTYRSS
jgi:hypothetical protein